jgi:hypothetical protein
MSGSRGIGSAKGVKELRAKAALFDELVEELARVEDEVERLRSAPAAGGGIDPAWREIANGLASALRPYSLFRDQVVRDGRIIVETRVPGATLSKARDALDRFGRQVALESYRRDGMAPDWRAADESQRNEGRRAA